MPDIDITRLDCLPIDDLQPMLEESQEQGFEFLTRLLDEYEKGINRFDKSGEGLFAIYTGPEMIAIGGLNHDPYFTHSSVARVRHVYVLSAWRRKGVGKRLIQHIIREAKAHFHMLTLRTLTKDADRFYRAVGFQTEPMIENATHHITLVGEYTLNTISPWMPGDPVVLRGVWRRKLWWAGAVTVVQDDSDLIALYWPAGTPEKYPGKRLTPRQLHTLNQVDLVNHTWVDTDVLMLSTPGAAHAVYAMWETGQTELRCWYIDLQKPLRRTPLGFDTMDHLLDIVVSPDRTEWRWKDEDEFSEAVSIGMYSPEEARAIREEGERTLALLQKNPSPYPIGWRDWTPPEEWEIPELPSNWDELF